MDKEILIYGIHAVRAALVQRRIKAIWFDQARHDQRMRTLREIAAHIPCYDVDRKVLAKMVAGDGHQGVVASCVEQPHLTEDNLIEFLTILNEPPFILILDGVQDPHNLGACLRSADAAGVNLVIAPRDRAVSINATVTKVASGAAAVVPFVQVVNLARTLRMLKEHGVWLIGTVSNAASSIYQIKLTGPLALIMGSEGRGLRRLSAEHCDILACIPMLGSVASLNVAVATGVCLFEALRQRQAQSSC